MKVRASVKPICDKCKVIRRAGVVRSTSRDKNNLGGLIYGTYCRC